jgi:hypothetical protein
MTGFSWICLLGWFVIKNGSLAVAFLDQFTGIIDPDYHD